MESDENDSIMTGNLAEQIDALSIELDSDAAGEGVSLASCLQVATVELPSFVDTLTVAAITPEIEKLLALHLDLTGVGSALKNWEYLAYFLGMDPKIIKYIQERVKHPDSPTVEVLCQFRNVNLGDLLRIIRDRLQRMDVVVALLPLLAELKQAPRNAAFRWNDSGLGANFASSSNSVGNDVSDRDLIRLKVSRILNERGGAKRHPPVQAQAQMLPTVSPAPSYSGSDGAILITFYPDNEQHVKYVRWLGKNLRHFGAKVIRDDSLLASGSQDMTSAIHSALQKASQVLCVLSDKYKEAVELESSDQRATLVRYLYKQMESEYLRLGCVNHRFRPLLFPFSQIHSSLPTGFLSSSLLWHWPSQQTQLFRLLFQGSDRADRFSLADDSLCSY